MSKIRTQIERAERRWKECAAERELVDKRLDTSGADGKPPWQEIERADRVMRRAERIGDLLLAESVVNAPPAEQPEFDPMERIIEESQLQGVQFFEFGLIAARTVCRILIRDPASGASGYGTGVLVGPGLLMTNNHVLGDAGMATVSLAQFDYLKSATGRLEEPSEFELRPDKFFVTNEALDFTLIATSETSREGDAVQDRGWCTLIPGSGKALMTERVNIIQHPGGERMQIAIRDNTIVAMPGDFLQYRADTQRGSSGSPVFNSLWELAALHHAGVPDRDDQGFILNTDGSRWSGRDEDAHLISWIANEGVRISSIVAHVNGLSLDAAQREIWATAFETPRRSSIWDKFDKKNLTSPVASERQSNAPSVSHDAATGRTTWNFSLSFGPTEQDQPRTLNQPALVSAPTADMSSPTTPSGPDARALAEAVLAQHHHDGPWYDADEDDAAKDNYWDGMSWSGNSSSLYARLQAHLETTHDPLTDYYKARWHHLYAKVDVQEDGDLRNIYSNKRITALDIITEEVSMATTAAMSRGYESLGLAGLESFMESDEFADLLENGHPDFNCEHVVCQSWFENDPGVTSTTRKHMKCDLHHLYTCEWSCNSFRSNIPYYDFGPQDERTMYDCGRKDGNRFEPYKGKGRAARATMYFLLRYKGIVGDRRTEFTRSRIPVLLDWHEKYPVDDFERHRNWLIEKAQGNRNPAIDFPDKMTKALLEKGFG